MELRAAGFQNSDLSFPRFHFKQGGVGLLGMRRVLRAEAAAAGHCKGGLQKAGGQPRESAELVHPRLVEQCRKAQR